MSFRRGSDIGPVPVLESTLRLIPGPFVGPCQSKDPKRNLLSIKGQKVPYHERYPWLQRELTEKVTEVLTNRTYPTPLTGCFRWIKKKKRSTLQRNPYPFTETGRSEVDIPERLSPSLTEGDDRVRKELSSERGEENECVSIYPCH